MNRPIEPAGSSYRTRFRMDTGVEVLEEWADSATQNEKNAVYKCLFAVSDGSVFKLYRTIDDMQRPNEFFVLVRKDLVVKIRVNCFDSFGITYIGPRGGVRALGHGEIGGLGWE